MLVRWAAIGMVRVEGAHARAVSASDYFFIIDTRCYHAVAPCTSDL